MKIFFHRPFFLILILIILINLLSFLGFLVPLIDSIIFFVLSILIIVLAFYRLDYATLVLVAELLVGSKGHLFSLDIGQYNLSLRMVIYISVLVSWIIGLLRGKYRANFLSSSLLIPYLLLLVFIFLGLAAGFLNNYPVNLILLDFNAWLYFLIIFPIFDVLEQKNNIDNLFKVFFTSITWLAIKTFLVFFIFSHQIKAIMPDLYYWIRLKGLGEITVLDPVYRVFFQSQIYSLIGFFILLSLFFISAENKNKNIFFLILPTLPIILSFSRSFWLAFLLTLTVFIIFLKIKLKFSWTKLCQMIILVGFIVVLSLAFLWLSLRLPPKAVFDVSDLLDKRIDLNEAAASSRLAQLPYLILAISHQPIIGSGFGTTVSYFSKDPRALERHPLGLYTTYAFEWGYLDIWLKIGFSGLIIFLFFIWQILKKGLDLIKSNKVPIMVGCLFGCVALIITHSFSPYLNHPLGIGYLVVCAAIFDFYGKTKN